MIAFAAAGVAACSPTLNWREIPVAGDKAVATFPCRPQSYQRRIRLATLEVQWQLQECTADGLTWAVGSADLEDPTRVTPALAALRRAMALNIGASSQRELDLHVAGETPNAASGAIRLDGGHLPDGSPAAAQVLFFAKGTTVVQATVVGRKLPEDAVQTFFGGLRLMP